MKYLQINWKSRTLIVLLISVLISVLLISLELTSWAEQINQQGFSHGDSDGERPNIPSGMIYILPFVKIIVLMGVPMLVSLLLIKCPAMLKRVMSKKTH